MKKFYLKLHIQITSQGLFLLDLTHHQDLAAGRSRTGQDKHGLLLLGAVEISMY